MEVKHQTRCVCLNLSHSPLLASSSPRRSAKPGSPWELGSLWGRFLISHGCCPRRGPSLTATSVGRVWGGGCSGVLGCHPVAPGDFPSCRKSLGISPHPKGAIPRCPVAGAGLLSPLSPGTAQTLNPSLVRQSPVRSSARMEISGELHGWRIFTLIPLQVLREGEVHWLPILPCCDKSLRSCFAAAHCEEQAVSVSRVKRSVRAHGSSHWERSQPRHLPGTPSGR